MLVILLCSVTMYNYCRSTGWLAEDQYMILELRLKSLKEKNKFRDYQIFGVDANEVVRIRQDFNKATFRKFIGDIIVAKLPSDLYQYEVINWNLVDHAEGFPPEAVAA